MPGSRTRAPCTVALESTLESSCSSGCYLGERVFLFRAALCGISLSTGPSRPGYWSGLPFPPPEDLPDPETEPKPLVSPALASGSSTTEPPGSQPTQVSLPGESQGQRSLAGYSPWGRKELDVTKQQAWHGMAWDIYPGNVPRAVS